MTAPSEKPIIERLKISGYKSIREAEIELGRLNVLIGANGSGKSNFGSVFDFLRASLREQSRLERYVASHGGAGAFLHLGPKHTEEIVVAVTLHAGTLAGSVQQRLTYGLPDKLAYGEHLEGLADLPHAHGDHVQRDECAIGCRPPERAEQLRLSLIEGTRVYHFCDTSPAAAVRRGGNIEQNTTLEPDARNLAAFLYRVKQTAPFYYERIVRTLRMAAPFISDLELAPRRLNPQDILLNWRQNDWDDLLGPHQLSDGTLRCIALISLLLQPENDLPGLVFIDEPELGLHPYALGLVASLLESASHHSQIIVATQSPTLLDHFEPKDVIVVDRDGPASTFRRLDERQLASWLEEYSLGEVWEKNVVGGGPF